MTSEMRHPNITVVRLADGPWHSLLMNGEAKMELRRAGQTILHDAAHPSSLLLPVLPELPPLQDPPVPVDQQVGIQPVSNANAVRQESAGSK